MKSILLKFADGILSKSEMKGLKGGNMPGGSGPSCSTECWDYVQGKPMPCTSVIVGEPWWGLQWQCQCVGGGGAQACG